jgi:hypothetical protein
MAGRGLALGATHMGLRVGGRAAGEVYRGREAARLGWLACRGGVGRGGEERGR